MHRRIYLMRHCEVDYFDSNGNPARFQDVPLNQHGFQQALEMRPLLEGVVFEKLFCSGLLRTVQTLQTVLGNDSVRPDYLQDFREIEPSAIHPPPGKNLKLWEKDFLGSLGPGLTPESKFMGGETFGNFTSRVNKALDELLADESWNCVLLVAHSVVNRWILCRFLNLGLNGISALEQDAGCLNLIELPRESSPFIRLLNYTPLDRAKATLRKNSLEMLLDKAHEAMRRRVKST